MTSAQSGSAISYGRWLIHLLLLAVSVASLVLVALAVDPAINGPATPPPKPESVFPASEDDGAPKSAVPVWLIAVMCSWILVYVLDLAIHVRYILVEMRGQLTIAVRSWKVAFAVYLAVTEIVWFAYSSKSEVLQPNLFIFWLAKDMLMMFLAMSLVFSLPFDAFNAIDERTARRDRRAGIEEGHGNVGSLHPNVVPPPSYQAVASSASSF
ncbi:hypothetical protein H9P43_002507 [Blastocladiella emersonii ATCC 22665]|nr:hypothetical protein H9P43_002507 [Blastocladiella emersonii ATCC 22665]